MIQDKIKGLTEKSGCYLYLDKNGKVIYVGKAKNLKKRVTSYFNKAQNAKTTKLVRDICDINTFITDNEKEALVLEQTLIKKYKPRYNIVLNDDKRYPYIVITKEKDPQYSFVRSYDKKFLKSFGPLPEGSSARNILKTLERIYPLRRCKGNLGKPCLHYHINQCSGACFKEVDKSYYDEMIKKVVKFFRGNTNDLANTLKEKMQIASDNLQFEEAQRIKEILQHIDLTIVKQEVDLNDSNNRDVFNYFTDRNKICINVLFYRAGKLSLKDEVILSLDSQEPEDLLKSYIVQIYDKNIIPDRIIIPKEIEKEDLEELYGKSLFLKHSKLEESLLKLSQKNAEETLKMSFMTSGSFKNKNEELLLLLQEKLGLPNYPYHIEMFDVANILDEYVTGAMVVFKSGSPSKNDFRKFNIDIDNPDDYHRMQNMIYRRYQKDLAKPENLPDLIIMDGGKIQVNACLSQLDLLGINIPVIGLIKNDKHKTDRLLNFDGNEIEIDHKSGLFNLLSNFQERVHQFAISSFRKRQEKGLIKNPLADIEGLGKKTLEKLYDKYPTLEIMKEATFDDLNNLIKNSNVTEKVISKLKKEKGN